MLLKIIISETLNSFAHNIRLGLLKIRQSVFISQYIPDTVEFLIRSLDGISAEVRNIPIVTALQNG